jgi:hypothetical protein
VGLWIFTGPQGPLWFPKGPFGSPGLLYGPSEVPAVVNRDNTPVHPQQGMFVGRSEQYIGSIVAKDKDRKL